MSAASMLRNHFSARSLEPLFAQALITELKVMRFTAHPLSIIVIRCRSARATRPIFAQALINKLNVTGIHAKPSSFMRFAQASAWSMRPAFMLALIKELYMNSFGFSCVFSVMCLIQYSALDASAASAHALMTEPYDTSLGMRRASVNAYNHFSARAGFPARACALIRVLKLTMFGVTGVGQDCATSNHHSARSTRSACTQALMTALMQCWFGDMPSDSMRFNHSSARVASLR
mmetsp:Transcript_95584/g.276062  ORF Transcript_95584/g.276062 Transcript_95584/m.276062 type:complete len:233 (+) Transcript_95584:598-1296(+)